MKIQNLFLTLLLLQIIFCLEPEEDIPNSNYIVFTKREIVASNEIKVSGTTATIKKPGIVYVTGESKEGNIEVDSDKVTLYLQDLKLSSKKTAPIIVSSNLKDVKIINIGNTLLEDLEDPDTTKGECAVIKIKSNSVVHFKNSHILHLLGNCKNTIRGVYKSSIIFDEGDGEYIIDSYINAISADNMLVFNGGVFSIESATGFGIRSKPDDDDFDSLGKILINYGEFYIKSYKDAVVAKSNITILDGKFDILTQNGYNQPIDDTVSSKGFKVTSDAKGSEIKIYSGDFEVNTADDSFRSNRDLIVLKGNFVIRSGDDAMCGKYSLVIGEKDAPLDDLNIRILWSYESLEGMTIKIYSGRIRSKASNDGINASGVVRHVEPVFNFTRRNRTYGNGTYGNRSNGYNGYNGFNGFNGTDWWNSPEFRNNSRRNNNSNTDWWNNFDFDFFNNTGFDFWGGQNRNNNRTRNNTRRYYFFGNDSYYISIFNGELYVDSDMDGFDSNGNIFIHGGNINIFSSDRGTDNPIDRDGSLTLFNAELLAVGVKGAGYVHKWIDKSNQFYCFYEGKVVDNPKLIIKNEKNKVVKEERITKNITYIFYSSSKINKDYHFYLVDKNDTETELKITCDYLEQGEDIDDINFGNHEEKKDEENKSDDNQNEENKSDEPGQKDLENKDDDNYSPFLNLYSIYFMMLILLF